MEYDILIRYEPESTEDWEAIVSVSAQALPTSPRCGNVLPSEQRYKESLPHTERYALLSRPFCFEPSNQYEIAMRFQRAGCPCKPHVIGRRCDQCAPGTYGLGPSGCSRCACSPEGSVSKLCDPVSGQCRCQPGAVGRRCLEGYYGDPVLGSGQQCRPCPCPGYPGTQHYHGNSCHADKETNQIVCLCAPGYTGASILLHISGTGKGCSFCFTVLLALSIIPGAEDDDYAPVINRFNRRVSGCHFEKYLAKILSTLKSTLCPYRNFNQPLAKAEKTDESTNVSADHSYVCAEAFNPDEEEEDTEPRVVHPKTDEQRCRLQEACKDILLFKNLDQEQLSQVLDAMFERKVKPQEHVIDQGDDGDNFYVVERGLYDIFVTRDSQPRCVGRYDNHGSFGELALMYNTPRAATIVATTEGALWGLDRVTFRRIILKNNAKKRKTFELFIESVPLLKSLEVSERMKIVDVIGEKVYRDGERIISQGDKADSFYIVESGEVKILIKSKTMTSKDANQEVEIARCQKGQYFGELALVTNKPRAASAYAVGDVKCLVMDVQAFERLLGPCMDIMKRNITHYEEQLVAMFGTSMDLLDPGN
ncbi:cAMP-dependent protein kinase type II-alpha regulatory subunit [Chelonia mydas]|uniref:cAMP-dependent protein kinase type II-alpha regulatory subunit n=1 Tax=Chelonia mydas TaxID=8469 RepID=M7B3L5_CHEMY|nr:cAMP-dependent protein kinase type II-alpha regulatory subunit [Chelonia mydas]